MTSVANYVLALTGRDIAGPFRGRYNDEAGAMALVEAHGGEVSIMEGAMASCGFARCAPGPWLPIVADVGPYRLAGISTETGGIFRASRGVYEGRCVPLATWLPCRQ